MAPITLYFLQASRAIRIAWLLEELGVDYDVVFSEREKGVAPPGFAKQIGTKLGKSPVIKDGDLLIQESGAITQYLCEQHDFDHRLIPTDHDSRFKVYEWIFASEATFMLHALAIHYARKSLPDGKGANASILQTTEQGMAENVQRDLDWLESELGQSKGKFLLGDVVTAADCNMMCSLQFILAAQLGTQDKKWEKIEQWLKHCEATPTYKAAVRKTGFSVT